MPHPTRTIIQTGPLDASGERRGENLLGCRRASAKRECSTGDRAIRIEFEPVPYNASEWGAVVRDHPEADVFHGPSWLEFLATSQGVTPTVLGVLAENRRVGFFVGATARPYGLPVLGSPMPGWGTQWMGFLLDEGVDRREAARALATFAFRELGRLHIEITDPRLTAAKMDGAGYVAEAGTTYRSDLTQSEASLQARVQGNYRRSAAQALRQGLTTEVATNEEFAKEYHAQLVEVFARKGLNPPYGPERVRQLIRALNRTEELLLLRVRSPTGESLATSLTVGMKGRTAVLWGTASTTDKAGYHPNQLLLWETIRQSQARGHVAFDMGGAGSYKAKYGGTLVETAHFHRTRYPLMRHGRSLMRRLVLLGRKIRPA